MFMQHIAAHDCLKLERLSAKLLFHTVRASHAVLTDVVLIRLGLTQLWLVVITGENDCAVF